MKLAILDPPRAVTLGQIPGAWRRVAIAAGVSALVTLLGWAVAASVVTTLAP